MPPIASKLTRVRVATVQGGPFAVIGYTTSFTLTEGEEGGDTIDYFGGVINEAGTPTLGGSFDIVWDLGDTLGQNVIRSAKRAGTQVWLEFNPAGTTTGSPFDRFQARITEVSRSSEAGGRVVTGSISYEGDPNTLTSGTIA